jgi:FAD:protein FMN transferase
MRSLLFLLCLSCSLLRPSGDEVMLRRSFYVMGTVCEVIAVAKNNTTAEAAVQAGFLALTLVDDKMSDYKTDSELSTLSRLGFQQKIKLSVETLTVLRLSRRFSELSSGAFDVTVGPLVDLWRTAFKQQQFPSDEERSAALQRVDFRSITFDEATGEAQLLRPEMRLDLGGIAKGYAEDLAAMAMLQAGAIGGRINTGGQVLVFGETPKEVAQVVIVDPRQPKKTLYQLALRNESISTTADYERGKVIAGTKVSHVVDPRTGKPAEGYLAAVVLHPRGADADALTKVLFVLGVEQGAPLVESQGGLWWVMRADGEVSMSAALQPKVSKPR